MNAPAVLTLAVRAADPSDAAAEAYVRAHPDATPFHLP